jgi:hypothetical protein
MPPYEKGRRGRKPSALSDAERRTINYEKRRVWEQSNPENVMGYRRTEVLKRCMERGGFPKLSTIHKYDITEDELRVIADEWGIDISLPDDD